MTVTVTTLDDGAALYRSLRDLLLTERDHLVHHRLDGLQGANSERERLLSHIADWEKSVDRSISALNDGTDDARLTQIVEGFPGGDRTRGRRLLGELGAVAAEARHLAGINHILVSRNLHSVNVTLEAFTGEKPGTTYTAKGGVASGSSQRLLTKRG